MATLKDARIWSMAYLGIPEAYLGPCQTPMRFIIDV